MKKTIKIIILTLVAVMLFTSATSVSANTIPREAVPDGTPLKAVTIAEDLVGNVFAKVQTGTGYAVAKAEANRILLKAIISGETDGFGFGVLSAIAHNSILEYRDMYLRPEFYAAAEETVRNLISDLITEVEKGNLDYESARKEAYARIYKTVDPTFDATDYEMVDPCYWNYPAIDFALLNRARKLLHEATDVYNASLSQ